MPFHTARDPLFSVFQAAAATVARRRGADPAGDPLCHAASTLLPGQPAMAQVAAAHTPSTCAGLGLALLRATVAGDTAAMQTLHDRLSYSACDPLWAETLLDYARTLQPDGRPKAIPYVRHAALSDFVLTARAASMRIALLSDWGTGTEAARTVAAQLAAHRPDAVVHLGDIYFAGTAEECAVNFLQPLRAVLPHAPLFSLCGNHDVYSGGEGYYGLLRRIGQPASYFCLRSPDRSWQLLAADTGLNDRDPFDETAALTFIEPDEEAWHADKLAGFDGRTVFLSHHQPFSAYAQIGAAANRDPTNPRLMQSFARLSRAGRIDAWFWGHEHALRLYAPYRGLQAGRNIGNGAIPLQASLDLPLSGLEDPPALAAAPKIDLVDGAYAHGFALLDVAPGGIAASYWIATQPEAPIHREMLGGGIPDA